MQNESDEFERAIGGDPAALGRLLEYQCRRMGRSIERRIPLKFRHLLDADDVLQQACVDAFRAFPKARFGSFEAFTAWFAMIVRRQLIDTLRALNAHRRGGEMTRVTSTGHSSASDFLAAVAAHSVTASRIMSRAEAVERLQRAIAILPQHYGEVVQRHAIEGESIEGVAARLGRSVGATLMIRARAYRLLAAALDSSAA